MFREYCTSTVSGILHFNSLEVLVDARQDYRPHKLDPRKRKAVFTNKCLLS